MLLAACGRSEPFAPQAVETRQAWEGIGIWGEPEDTAPMNSIRGEVIEAPDLSYRSNGLLWTVRTIERIDRGVARAWPGAEDRWVAVRLDLSLDHDDSIETPTPREVILREQVVLIDREGTRRLPLQVHDRIVPPIDRPIRVDTGGFEAVLLFSIPRDGATSALEIHDPLGETRLVWTPEEAPPGWIPVMRDALLTDEARKAIWEVRLRNVLPRDDAFSAELSLRNVSSEPRELPDLAAARLYTGGGATIRSATPPRAQTLAPGRSVTLILRFRDVPRRESLELILPAGGGLIRIDALPGLLPEKTIPLQRPAVSEGIRATVHGARRDTELRIRLGLLNLSEAPVPLGGILLEALSPGGAVAVSLSATPETLWPGFEERRWTAALPTDAKALRIAIPGRRPFIVTF